MAILLRCPSCRTDQSIKNKICMKCGKNLSRKREYIVVIKMPNGKWIKRVCGSNLDVAKAIEAKIKTEIREGKFIDKKKPTPTLDEVWEKYLEWAKVNKKSWKEDYYRYRKHISPRFGTVPLDKISSFEIERMIIELKKSSRRQGKVYANKSIHHCVELVRRLYNAAINWGLYKGANPASAKKIKMSRVDNVVTEFLSEAMLCALLRALDKYAEKDLQAANLVRFALFTGMRRGELFKLEWKDVDMERGFVHLRSPKGGKSEILPLNKYALKVLKNNPRRGNSPYVFPGRNGKMRTSIRKAWVTIKKMAGLPENFRFHGLRHAYGSLLVSSGKVDLYTVQRLLTHKSFAMTQRYAHLSENVLRRATEVMDEIVEKATRKQNTELTHS